MVDEDLRSTCAACGCELALDLTRGMARSSGGRTRRLSYVDDALAVWDCPECGSTDAADLLGDPTRD